MGIEIAAYYFPNYHVDPANELRHGSGWTEWELLRAARPRFPGHQQPRRPFWGYEDESRPAVMLQKTQAARRHGIDAFIFDYYWHENGPFLQGALERGFLPLDPAHGLKFALMWANHDWVDIHPAHAGAIPYRQAAGAVSPEAFRTFTGHVIRTYFTHPAYWRVNGRLYFSIYELHSFLRGMGGIQPARAALDEFRERTARAGLPELHLNAIVWGLNLLPCESVLQQPQDIVTALGFDSVGSYVWVHDLVLPDFPASDYAAAIPQIARKWRELAELFPLPYFPNVTMGWDPSPRTSPGSAFENHGYPFMPVWTGNTPERFRDALECARIFLRGQPDRTQILTLNAWNEWTEGSYLEPDTMHGLRYLQALRDVFGCEAPTTYESGCISRAL